MTFGEPRPTHEAMADANFGRERARWARRLPAWLAATALVFGALAAPHDRRLQAVVVLALLFGMWRIGGALVSLLRLELAPLSRIVATFTFAVAFGSFVATWLGHFAMLRPAPFLLVLAGAVIAASWAPQRDGEESCGGPAFGAAVGGTAHSRQEASDTPPADAVAPPRGARALADRIETIAAIGTGAAMVLGYVAETLRRFVLPLHGGPDDISYHLTAVAVWQRWGDLRMVKFSMGDWGTAFYPILPELSSWMLLTPFRDSDVAARWSELPFALLSFVAVAAIARRLGVGRRGALLAAALYGALRLVAALAFAAGNDHVTAFCTLAALDAALACAERPRLGRFAYLGTALGLLVASKYLGIYNAITVLLVFAVAYVLRARQVRAAAVAPPQTDDERVNREPARLLPGAAVLLATLALAGGYTYLRNWVATGNPVYPQPVHVGGLQLFGGREELSLGGRRGGEDSEIDVWSFLAGADNAFAGFFPFTLLPAALLAPILAAALRRWRDAAVLALPAAFFLEFLYWTWDHRDVRYVFAGIALAAIAFAWLSERLGTAGAWIRIATCAVVLYRYVRWLGARGDWELLAAVTLVVAVVLGWRTWPRWGGRARLAAKPGLAILVLTVALALGCSVARYQRTKLADSPAAMALERLTGGRGTTVGYVGLNQPYLFFGGHLQNDVRIVPRSFNLRAEHYRWGGVPERPFRHSTYARWIGVVKILGIQYVVVVRSPDEDPERTWMANHWDRFRRVYTDETTEVWKLLPASEPAPRRR